MRMKMCRSRCFWSIREDRQAKDQHQPKSRKPLSQGEKHSGGQHNHSRSSMNLRCHFLVAD